MFRIGLPRDRFGDLYHQLLVASWTRIMAGLTGAFLGINALFAVLYVLGGDSISGAAPGSFSDAFAFSVQTFATIGYGVFAPNSAWAHALVAAESLAGILFNALATGLVFARFARPTARVMFAKNPIILKSDGVPTLQLRVANARGNQIVDATASLSLSRMERSVEGTTMRRFHTLTLVRSTTPMFAMTWTVFHRIDAASPLFGATPQSLEQDQALLVLLVSGTDETMVHTVQARSAWTSDLLRWDHQYVDVLQPHPSGGITVRYDLFHDTVEVDAAHRLTAHAVVSPPP